MKYINQLADCRDVDSMSLREIAAASAWWFQNYQPGDGFSPATLGEATYRWVRNETMSGMAAVKSILEKLARGDIATDEDKSVLFEAWLPGEIARQASGTERNHMQAMWCLLSGQEERGRKLFSACYR